ncbi:MAG: hypothetical protein AAB606_04400 [Patescibacteria group bacterium]
MRELKTAAMRDELFGEERREGRPASIEAEAETTCRRFPLPAPTEKTDFVPSFLLRIEIF